MSAYTKWFNSEQSIMIHRYEGEWSIGDYRQSVKDANQLLDSVNHEVVHFLDMRDGQGMPKSFMSTFYRSAQNWHNNSGRVVMIGASSFILAFLRFYRKLYPNPKANFFIVDSIEEALEVIGEVSLEIA